MTVVNPPAWMQTGGTYPARTDRNVLASLVRTSGVISAADLVVSQSTTPGMTVTVSAGRAWIVGTQVSYQGVYNFINDSEVILPVDTSHASLGRRDIVVARIQDASVSGSVNLADVTVITGTPSASPVVPTTPANSIRLATLTVNANATSITTSNINRSDVPIATLHRQLSNSVEVRTSTTRPNSAERFVGMQIFETDTQRRFMWNGSIWAYQGGGKAPRATMSTGVYTNRSAASADIYWMAKVTSEWDDAYFTFGNGTSGSAGDYIKVTESGMYAVHGYIDLVQQGPGYYSYLHPRMSPGLGGFPVPAQGNQTYTNGKAYHQFTQVHYLTAGTNVYLRLYNTVVVGVEQAGMVVTRLA